MTSLTAVAFTRHAYRAPAMARIHHGQRLRRDQRRAAGPLCGARRPVERADNRSLLAWRGPIIECMFRFAAALLPAAAGLAAAASAQALAAWAAGARR
jgi:hypothetical protein